MSKLRNLQLYRNPDYSVDGRDAAIAEMYTELNVLSDGEPILVRYTDNFMDGTISRSAIRTLLGIAHKSSDQGFRNYIEIIDDHYIIDSSELFASGNPLVTTSAEGSAMADRFRVGDMVWDLNTEKHYIFSTVVIGQVTYYCFMVPTVENRSYILNNMDDVNEVLTLEHELNIELGVKRSGYIPVTSQPSDWQTNWNKYYLYVNGSFVLNTNSMYVSGTVYYKKVNDDF